MVSLRSHPNSCPLFEMNHSCTSVSLTDRKTLEGPSGFQGSKESLDICRQSLFHLGIQNASRCRNKQCFSVCPFQFSAWTAAPWSAPLSSRLCAPWTATKLKCGSQRMAAVPCQQGWFVTGSSFLSDLFASTIPWTVFLARSLLSLGKPNPCLFLWRNHWTVTITCYLHMSLLTSKPGVIRLSH